jgi:hypothetical protein
VLHALPPMTVFKLVYLWGVQWLRIYCGYLTDIPVNMVMWKKAGLVKKKNPSNPLDSFRKSVTMMVCQGQGIPFAQGRWLPDASHTGGTRESPPIVFRFGWRVSKWIGGNRWRRFAIADSDYLVDSYKSGEPGVREALPPMMVLN